MRIKQLLIQLISHAYRTRWVAVAKLKFLQVKIDIMHVVLVLHTCYTYWVVAIGVVRLYVTHV